VGCSRIGEEAHAHLRLRKDCLYGSSPERATAVGERSASTHCCVERDGEHAQKIPEGGWGQGIDALLMPLMMEMIGLSRPLRQPISSYSSLK